MGQGPNANKPVDVDMSRSANAELQKLRDDLQHERELLAREREELERRIQKLERNDENEQDLRARIRDLEEATKLGNTMPKAGGSGNVIVVRRGDFIAYNTRLEHGPIHGGWVKCSKDEKVSAMVPIIAVANKDFQYDDSCGAPYHSVSFNTYKRFFQDPNKAQVVGNGLPAPIIATPGVPTLTLA